MCILQANYIIMKDIKSDIEIAQEAKMNHINEVALSVGVSIDDLELYGKYKAKLPFHLMDNSKISNSNLILVTAMTPTPAGEGKTTTSIGLTEGLNKIGKKALVVLREPSQGPVFGVKGVAAGNTDADHGAGGLTIGNTVGTEGLFAAIETRGNVTTGILGTNAATDLAEFDLILAEFDNQGAIEENMMFVNRATSLAMDDMLASMNSYGAGGTSYGVFDNSEDMALNLGFSGFRRGSYDFYKTDWKYLNDITTGGAFTNIRGVVVPAGTSTVYDQTLGKNIKRPFLHVRYRASEADDRKMKSWTTGSVGGATTSDLDAMEVHYLSERCLVVQGANNFMLLN